MSLEKTKLETTSLETVRLSLFPCLPAQLLALMEDPERFEEMAGFPASPGLCEMFGSEEVLAEISPEWLAALRVSEGPDPWRYGYFIVRRATGIERLNGAAIGTAGFKGPPDESGMVEIAYGVAPEFRGQGYATEAATTLVAFAFDTAGVELVRAHTLPVPNASTRVLTKCGFRHVGEVVDPDDGPVWRWERSR